MDDYHVRGHERRDYRPRVRLATPEGVEVELELAGVGTRGAATAIDVLVLGALAGVALLAALALGSVAGDVVLAVVGSALTLVVVVGYDVACELAFDGRTAGKAALGLRVVRTDGRRVDALASLARNATRLLELPLFYLPAIVMVWLTARQQRFGDLVGGTLVVRQPRGRRGAAAPAEPDEVPVAADPRLAERVAALDVTALRHEDLALARTYVARAETLDPARRAAIAADLATGLRARLGVGTDDLADDDVVRVALAAAAQRP